MHYHNSTDKQTFLLFIILFWIIGLKFASTKKSVAELRFHIFLRMIMSFPEVSFFLENFDSKEVSSTFSLTSASAAKMWKQASGGGLSLSWLQRFNFELNQLGFPVFHLLFDLVFQDFSSLTLIPQFSCFSVFGDFVSIISSVTTSAALPPSFAVLEALQYSLLLCAKVLFRLFYLKAICRGHALFLTWRVKLI